MHRVFASALFLSIACQWLHAEDVAPVLIKKVDPNEGRQRTGFIFDAAEVDLTLDDKGVPFALAASIGLPDYVVQALEQWRYSPYKKNGHNVPFGVKLSVPVARALSPQVERQLLPRWRPSGDAVRQALKAGHELDDAGAASLAADLPDAEALGNPRTSLLVYYANQGAKNPESARAARAKLITWLVEHYPQDDILGSTFAIVNRSGDPLADSDTSAKLTKMWIDISAQNPADEKIRLHALNFLTVASPQNALAILVKLPNWNETSVWAGEVYGLASVRVIARSAANGASISASNSPGTPAVSATARTLLLKSTGTKMVLAGLAAAVSAGRSLAAHHALPDDYSAFCQSLLAHARELYPQTAQSCDTSQPSGASVESQDRQTIPPKLLKRVEPSYPPKARDKRVQGTVTLSAVISESGEPTDIQLKSGPLLLYSASADAVRKWRFKPATLDGKPVAMPSTIETHFSLGHY
jgi:TonB family protein